MGNSSKINRKELTYACKLKLLKIKFPSENISMQTELLRCINWCMEGQALPVLQMHYRLITKDSYMYLFLPRTQTSRKESSC